MDLSEIPKEEKILGDSIPRSRPLISTNKVINQPAVSKILSTSKKEKPPIKSTSSIPEDFDLQTIPKISLENQNEAPIDKKDFLPEVTPTPFKGSIIASKFQVKKAGAVPTPTENKNLEISTQETPLISSNNETPDTDVSVIKQKQLKEDMESMLGFLSKKLILPIETLTKPEPIKTKVRIPPDNINEILKQLLTIDVNIEASAIIKTDGTILATAISSRITDALFATIGQNLSMIGSDIINGLSAGKLKSISVRGSEGVLDLASIDANSPYVKDVLLIIFSNPKVKSGVINIAANFVKKQIKQYLGVKK